MRSAAEQKYAAQHVSHRVYHKIALPNYYGVTLLSGISDGSYHVHDLIIRLHFFSHFELTSCKDLGDCP